MNVRGACTVLLLLAGTAAAGEIHGTCDVRFLGGSTLHDFAGTGRCLPFTAPLRADAAGSRVLGAVEVELPVAEMRTGIGARDRRMREMFDADRHPTIRASARDVDVDDLRARMLASPDGGAALEITLAIRGVERKIATRTTHLKEDGNRVFFDVAFPVSLREFGLSAPTVLGIIRVADRVEVEGRFTLEVASDP
jgi:polyisoprenoid-binding protein YceI